MPHQKARDKVMLTMSDIIPTTPQGGMQVYEDVAAAGAAADAFARSNVFENWRIEMAQNTRRRKAAGVDVYAQYVCELASRAGSREDGVQMADSLKVQCAMLQAFAEDVRDDRMVNRLDGSVWGTMTFGLVESFKSWMLEQGYSIGTVNNRVSTLKNFSDLAFRAGFLSTEANMLIQSVKGYGRKSGNRIDENRQAKGVPTRVGNKKAKAVEFSNDEVDELLKALDGSPQGLRDRLMICLLREHGLRVSELADLKVDDFNLAEGKFTFYRRKTDQTETHEFKRLSGKAIRAYFNAQLALPGCHLLRTSKRDKNLKRAGMSTSAIRARVKKLGKLIEIENLSPHDFRHFYATDMVKSGTELDAGVSGGGWASPTMYFNYVNKSKVANEGVKLSTDQGD